MILREAEKELGKGFSKVNKSFFGRGPQHIAIKITGNMLFCKLTMSFSECEFTFLKRLLELQDQDFLNEVLMEYKDDYLEVVNSFFNEKVEITEMKCCPIPNEECICYLLFFNKNLEKII